MNNNFNLIKENIKNKLNHFVNVTGFKYLNIEFNFGDGKRVSTQDEYGIHTFNPYVVVDFGDIDLYNPDRKHSKRFTNLIEKLEKKYGVNFVIE